MAAPKGQGTVVYFDTDSDDQYRAVDCIITVKPSGFERGVTEEDACLDDVFVDQDTGDLKLTPITGTMRFDVNEANTENALETAIQNDDSIKIAIKVPKATPVYIYATGKLTKLEPAAVTRSKKYTRDFEFLPQAIPTKSTTAPTLEA